MKHSLYLKFILAYLIFGFLSFFTIAVFSSQLTLDYLTKNEAEDLYREANYISSNFVRNYYSDSADSRSLSTIHSHFQALDTYLGADIWLLNADGTVLVNSAAGYSGESATVMFSGRAPRRTQAWITARRISGWVVTAWSGAWRASRLGLSRMRVSGPMRPGAASAANTCSTAASQTAGVYSAARHTTTECSIGSYSFSARSSAKNSPIRLSASFRCSTE